MPKPEKRDFIALGLMSGTSMDGVDLACLKTDGHMVLEKYGGLFVPFDNDFRRLLADLMKRAKAADNIFQHVDVDRAAQTLMHYYKRAIDQYCEEKTMSYSDFDLVGIHGQTLYHAPHKGVTWQLSDGAWLAGQLGVSVIDQFRLEDVSKGGEGAPLLPIYHHAMIQSGEHGDDDFPMMLLNLGGVGNITFIPKGADLVDLIAFDCGPANAYIDQAMMTHFQKPYDEGGQMALKGTINQDIVAQFKAEPWFDVTPPKSLDRHHFDRFFDLVQHLSAVDQIATLTMLSVVAVAKALNHLPEKPKSIVVVGGGSNNATMLRWIADETGIHTLPYPEQADLVEAEGFAFMAVRSLLGLPITFPQTTKAPHPLCGGRLHKA